MRKHWLPKSSSPWGHVKRTVNDKSGGEVTVKCLLVKIAEPYGELQMAVWLSCRRAAPLIFLVQTENEGTSLIGTSVSLDGKTLSTLPVKQQLA